MGVLACNSAKETLLTTLIYTGGTNVQKGYETCMSSHCRFLVNEMTLWPCSMCPFHLCALSKNLEHLKGLVNIG